MNINEFFDMLGDSGVYGVGGIIALITSTIVWISERAVGSPKLISNFFYILLDFFASKKMKNSKEFNIVKETDVLNHDLFKYIDHWVYNKVPTLEFSTKYRTIIFRKYLGILLKNYNSNLQSWIQSKKFEDLDKSQLWSEVLGVINNIISQYELEMVNSKIPSVIIEKMKVRNNDTISLIVDLLESICDSEFYDSEKNLLKVYSILNILLCVLEYTISSSEKVCNLINGQISGMSIDGETEP
jgi:hypothetical protein